MKTNFKSILAVTLAATTFFSCSNEIEAPDNAQMLNPGDAQISIDLSQGGTTYSTIALEDAIKSGSGMLFDKAGKKINLTDAVIKNNAGKLQFSAIIKAGTFVDGDANLYLYTNGTPSVSETEAQIKTATTNTVLGRDLPNGLPAGFGPLNVKLAAGAVTAAGVSLVRTAARVAAVSGNKTPNATDIKGYTVNLAKANTKSAGLFAAVPSVGDTDIAYTLTGVIANMYKNSETVGYIYPSGTVINGTVKAPAPSTVEKPFSFTPMRGMNYTIVITPAPTTGDANLSFDVAIKEWDSADGGNVDFATGDVKVTIPNAPIAGVNGFAGNAAGELVVDATAAAAGLVTSAGVNLTTEQLFGKANADKEAGFTFATITRAGESKLMSEDGNLVLSSKDKTIAISALPNYVGDTKYTVVATGATTNTKYSFVILVKGLGFHSEFVTEFNGFKVMTLALVSTGTGAATNSEYVSKFATSYSGIPAHKVFNGSIALGSRFNSAGTKSAAGVCPKGFRMLKDKAELAKFLGLTTWSVVVPQTVAVAGSTKMSGGETTIRFGKATHGNYYSAILQTAKAEQLAIVSDEVIRATDGSYFSFISGNGSAPGKQQYQRGEGTASTQMRCIQDSFK